VSNNGHSERAEWEVRTDPYNNTYIRCHLSGSTAWYQNDGNLLYFTHYEGNKKALLYYFFLAAFKVQQGYYQDMVLKDRYPLNLLFKPPLLTFQDLVAPFGKFLRSEFELKYIAVDSEMSPSLITLGASSSNLFLGSLLKRLDFILTIDNKGVRQLHANGSRFNIVATCTDS
jgi:hypothetical protein